LSKKLSKAERKTLQSLMGRADIAERMTQTYVDRWLTGAGNQDDNQRKVRMMKDFIAEIDILAGED
jgi:hypothetical protein